MPESPHLKRTLSLFDATALAIGAIIGTGIFVISGVASSLAGPAVIMILGIYLMNRKESVINPV
ncbi:MAG: hypothetical protein AB1608_02665 [Thermoproteota archaeon]